MNCDLVLRFVYKRFSAPNPSYGQALMHPYPHAARSHCVLLRPCCTAAEPPCRCAHLDRNPQRTQGCEPPPQPKGHLLAWGGDKAQAGSLERGQREGGSSDGQVDGPAVEDAMACLGALGEGGVTGGRGRGGWFRLYGCWGACCTLAQCRACPDHPGFAEGSTIHTAKTGASAFSSMQGSQRGKPQFAHGATQIVALACSSRYKQHWLGYLPWHHASSASGCARAFAGEVVVVAVFTQPSVMHHL